MIAYTQGTLLKKYWGWFEAPHDVSGFSAATFFSYEKKDIPGFHRKETLTSMIDLLQSEDDIWSSMRESFIRKQIEQGKRRGITVTESKDFSSFYPLYTTFAKEMNFEKVPRAILEKNGILFLAHHEEHLLAGGVFIGDGEYMRAWVLASGRFEKSGRMRDLTGQANRLVVWEAIKFAKENRYRQFDLGGIAPDSENPGWKAVAVFKEAFGGKRAPAYYYHRVYSPLLRIKANMRRFLPI